MPTAGELREEVVIKQAAEVADGIGGTTINWSSGTTIATARAKVEPLRGTEQLDMGMQDAEAEYRIWIRWRTGVSPKHRIFWRSRELDIVSVQNFRYENEWMEIMAKEHQSS